MRERRRNFGVWGVFDGIWCLVVFDGVEKGIYLYDFLIFNFGVGLILCVEEGGSLG